MGSSYPSGESRFHASKSIAYEGDLNHRPEYPGGYVCLASYCLNGAGPDFFGSREEGSITYDNLPAMGFYFRIKGKRLNIHPKGIKLRKVLSEELKRDLKIIPVKHPRKVKVEYIHGPLSSQYSTYWKGRGKKWVPFEWSIQE